MRRFALMGCMIFAVGCGPAEDQAAPETEAPAMEEAAVPSLADFAGTWSMRAMNEAGDSVLIEYEMVATTEPEGWTVTFPGRDPIAASMVQMDSDSVTIDLGPYASALREDVNVTTHTVVRMVDGRLIGYFVATYDTEGEDSVLRGMQEGQRIH